MIALDVEQGSLAWMNARVGLLTCSKLDRIITPGGKRSASASGLAHQLLAEQLLGVPMDAGSSGFMQRGQVMEKHAVNYYELQTEMDTEKVGLILRDDRRVGGSPDRLVGTVGGLEIKCPAAATHVGYMLDDAGIGYKAQVQGLLWLTEREWWDTLSYHPDLPCALVRQQRDEDFIRVLAREVENFLGYLDECKEQLQKKGLFAGWERAPLLAIA